MTTTATPTRTRQPATGLHNAPGRVWWLHGSAPGGEAFFDAAQDLKTLGGRRVVTVTTNAGIVPFLCHRDRQARPDYYWLQDPRAETLFGRYAMTARALGTRVLSGRDWLPQTLPDLACKHIDLVEPRDNPPRFIPGAHQHVTLSGLLCLQYIANRSRPCDTVVLTGMTGYASTPAEVVKDTFDGRMGKAGGEDHTTQRIAPFTRSVVEALPGVRFIFCGKPHRVFGADPKTHPTNLTVCANDHEMVVAVLSTV